MNNCLNNKQSPFSWLLLLLAIFFTTTSSIRAEYTDTKSIVDDVIMDVNGDGTVNILVLGTNSSINFSSEAFSPNQIAEELQSILSADASINFDINVVAEDIHMSKVVTVGLGGGGTEYNWTHYSHSLMQYYYWPDGLDDRMANLRGDAGTDWDYVVIGADPYIISTTPGYYSLGVNKVAAKVAEGGAQTLLLMMWSEEGSSNGSIEHFEEFTYRTSDGAKVELSTIPVGLAWDALSEDKKDIANIHPTPNGSYLTAASIYAHIACKSASASEYTYDDELADLALAAIAEEKTQVHYTGIRTFMSPFRSCDINEDVISHNHTGSSSENGIRTALNWVFNLAPESFQNGGESPINFNYGRANTNFEPNKRYQINPELFDFSFGFPMQDHGNHGNVSMLYGIDKRNSGTFNDTDLGVAQYMVQQSELPYGRAMPIRTLFAQMREAIPGQSAYRDSWHMHRDLDKAVAAYMYTLITGSCVVGEEPTDANSEEWNTWMSHKIGFETAWNLMYLEGEAPSCSQLVDLDGDGFSALLDCDDTDINVNPDQTEVPYNGIDEDCNTATLDDDLDQDGFALADDCDDTDATVNSDQIEVPYNGKDDDCNAETLDDDLDQDGFLLADDCDDSDTTVNSDQTEVPYNGKDDDCNAETLDDDLDQDGFLLADDCDDTDVTVNSAQVEVPYNGKDDDCNAETLDDDLDQDGFLFADDCNDNNININPDAEEIPNNDIDEDCDGEDLVTSIYELDDITVSIYPNPVIHIINIKVNGDLKYSVKVFDWDGKLVVNARNLTVIDVQDLVQGTYILELENLDSGKKIVERIVKVN